MSMCPEFKRDEMDTNEISHPRVYSLIASGLCECSLELFWVRC